jgi:hypothetical protein
MDELCDIEWQRRRRTPLPPQTQTNAYTFVTEIKKAEVLAWTPININKLRGKKVYWNPMFSCSSVLKA